MPPTADELELVLSAHTYFSPVAAVAAFLCSPVSALPGLAAGVAGASLWIRDFTCPSFSDREGVSELARAAAGLALAAHREGDRYIDLRENADGWAKVLRSGHRRVAFGPDLLWGAPKVSLEDGVAAARVADFVSGWRTGTLRDLPAICGGAGLFFVDGNHRRVVLRALTSPPAPDQAPYRPSPVQHARHAALDLCARTGGVLRFVSWCPHPDPSSLPEPHDPPTGAGAVREVGDSEGESEAATLVDSRADGPGGRWRARLRVGAQDLDVCFTLGDGSYQVDQPAAAGGLYAPAWASLGRADADGFAVTGRGDRVHVATGLMHCPVDHD